MLVDFSISVSTLESFHCENLSSESLSLPADSTRAIKATDSRTAEIGLIPIRPVGEGKMKEIETGEVALPFTIHIEADDTP